MVAAVLLYVGAVLVINGLWLLGQTYETGVLKISPKEIAVINTFTGGLGLIVAFVAIARGGLGLALDVGSVALGGYILLFAFTYLWVAVNQVTGADGRGLGWYSLFVAITAVPTGAVLLNAAGGDPWLTWLGISWLAWAVLWFLFFLLLSLQMKIARLTGAVAMLEGVLTAWLPAWLLFQGYLQF